jgi:acetylornithine/succinyldiaminopimelate/putrescine aminotransferase
MTPGTHGSTFGGNPLAMAVGNAVLDVVLAPGFLEHVQKKPPAQAAWLAGRRIPTVIRSARRGPAARPQDRKCRTAISSPRCARTACSCVGAGDNVVRLLPPLIVTKPKSARPWTIAEPPASPARESRRPMKGDASHEAEAPPAPLPRPVGFSTATLRRA